MGNSAGHHRAATTGIGTCTVKFELDDITTAVREEMASKADARLARIGQLGAHDKATWREIADFGLLTGDADGLRNVDVVAGMMALARGGLPGPVLEAALAVASGSSAAEAAVRSGELVSSIQRDRKSTRLNSSH